MGDKIFATISANKDVLSIASSVGSQQAELAIDIMFQLRTMPPKRALEEPMQKQFEAPLARRELERSWRLYLSALAYIAEADYALEVSQSEPRTTRLDPDLRLDLLRLMQREMSGDDTKVSRLRSRVADELMNVYGGGGRVRQARLAPHLVDEDVVLKMVRRDGGWEAAPVDQAHLDSLSAGVRRAPAEEEGVRWLALVCPKSGGLNGNGKPLGPVAYKVRQLKGLGYAVAVVQPYAFNSKELSDRAAEYLMVRINDALRQEVEEE